MATTPTSIPANMRKLAGRFIDLSLSATEPRFALRLAAWGDKTFLGYTDTRFGFPRGDGKPELCGWRGTSIFLI